MRSNLIPLLVWFLCLFTGAVSAQVDSLRTRVLSPQEMQDDFAQLCEVFQETHPGYYRYTSPEQMQVKIDSIQGLIQKELPFYTFYKILCSMVADVRCSHTQIYPLANPGPYFNEQQLTFPLSIQALEGGYYVLLNGTMDEGIAVGTEVLTINGRAIQEIEQEITRLHWGDGYILGNRMKAMSQGSFSSFYYVWVEQVEHFNLSLKNRQGEVFSRTVPAQTWAQTNQNFLKNPVNQKLLEIYQKKNQEDAENSWRLKILDEPQAAVMIIRDFNRGKTEEQARKQMQKFLQECSEKIQAKQIEHLIIDLRHNSGGWDIQGAELFSFLIQEPTQYYKRLHTITRDSPYLKYAGFSPKVVKKMADRLVDKDDGTFSLLAEYNPTLEMWQPAPYAYRGKVFVLMNGNSSSTTAEFTALAREHQLATFVGEECGGAYEGGNSGSFFEIILPNSGMMLLSPLVYYTLAVSPPDTKGRGTFPDYPASPILEDVLVGIDNQMEYVLDLIRKERK